MAKLYYSQSKNAAAFMAAFIAAVELDCAMINADEIEEATEEKKEMQEKKAKDQVKEVPRLEIKGGHQFYDEGMILSFIADKVYTWD